MPDVELRCPTLPRRQFAKLRADGTVDIACADCRKMMRSMGADVVLVVHRYGQEGFIETFTTLAGDDSQR